MNSYLIKAVDFVCFDGRRYECYKNIQAAFRETKKALSSGEMVTVNVEYLLTFVIFTEQEPAMPDVLEIDDRYRFSVNDIKYFIHDDRSYLVQAKCEKID